MKNTLIFLSLLFVLFSFVPSFYEIFESDKLPPERTFVLEHNYMFDYNFYLSRIREGYEGRWLVVEKYYHEPHQGSLMQILYLYIGKIGKILGVSPPVVYHASRLIFGFIFLILTGYYISLFFKGWWRVASFLFIATLGSWPIPVEIENGWRFATYMGWWSVIDSLQRITFIPHIIFGQLFLLILLWVFSNEQKKYKRVILWSVAGLIVGVVFPPTLIVLYASFFVLSVVELLHRKGKISNSWMFWKVVPRIIFIAISSLALIYLSFIFQSYPWKALAEFDVQHRILLPYREYALALGPILPLGILGAIIVSIRRKKSLYPILSWLISVGMLFLIFQNIPQQSPSRFTEAALHIPLGILGTYFLYQLWQVSYKLNKPFQQLLRWLVRISAVLIIIVGIGVMYSMVGWLTDQAKGKRVGTWLVPIGAQLAYPLNDFMEAIYYLKDNTNYDDVVLGYVTAGNFIPAYAGNFVYLGHANTPDEDGKEIKAVYFFAGDISENQARIFLKENRIKYVYFGPQEKNIAQVDDLKSRYPFIEPVYSNSQVTIYKFLR